MKKVMEIPGEFKRLLDNNWREAAVFGGRCSLKSHTVARVLLIRALQKKTRIGCFREFQNSIAESSHQLLKDLIVEYDLKEFQVTESSIINTINGSDFLFKGLHRNEQNVKSTEGIDLAWVEEAQMVSEKSLEVLTPTVRKEGSQIIYTYNRIEEDDPVHKRIVIDGRPNSLIIKVDYLIALKYGFMPGLLKEEMEDDKKFRPNLFKHKWLGEPERSVEGRVYNNWNLIDEIPHEARLERRGVDFGYYPDPVAVLDIYWYNGGIILDEILYQRGVKNPELASTLKNLPQILHIADSAEPKSIDELRMFGLNVIGAEKGPDSVRHGVKTLQSQKISITKRSLNLIKEYRGYMNAYDKRTNMPIMGKYEGENHLLDAARYAICSLIPVKVRKERLSQVPFIPSKPQTNPV